VGQFQVATLPLHAALLPEVTLPEPTDPYDQQSDVLPFVPQYAVAVVPRQTMITAPQHVELCEHEPPV
jgi:hypothetical protein